MSETTESKVTDNRPHETNMFKVILGLAFVYLIYWLLQRGLDSEPIPQVVNGQPAPVPFNLPQNDSKSATTPTVPIGARMSVVGKWTTDNLSDGVPATLTLAPDGSLLLEPRAVSGAGTTGTWTVDGDALSLWIKKDGTLRPWNVVKVLSDTSFCVTDRTGARAVFTRTP